MLPDRLRRPPGPRPPSNPWLGARFVRLTPGEAERHVRLRPTHRQPGGRADGGVPGDAADNTLTFAGGTRLGADAVTAEDRICLLRPTVGRTLVARAGALHAGRSQALGRCDLLVVDAGEPVLCATALGTIVRAGGR